MPSTPQARWPPSQTLKLFQLLLKHVKPGAKATSSLVPWKRIARRFNAASGTTFTSSQILAKVRNSVVTWRQMWQRMRDAKGAGVRPGVPLYWEVMNEVYERSGIDPTFVYAPKKEWRRRREDESGGETSEEDESEDEDDEESESEDEDDEESESDEAEVDDVYLSLGEEVDEVPLSLEAEVDEVPLSLGEEESSCDDADRESFYDLIDDSKPEVDCDVISVASKAEAESYDPVHVNCDSVPNADLHEPVSDSCNAAAAADGPLRADTAWLRFLPGHGTSSTSGQNAWRTIDPEVVETNTGPDTCENVSETPILLQDSAVDEGNILNKGHTPTPAASADISSATCSYAYADSVIEVHSPSPESTQDQPRKVVPENPKLRQNTPHPYRRRPYKYPETLNARILEFGEAWETDMELEWEDLVVEIRQTYGYRVTADTLRKRFLNLRHLRNRVAQGTVAASRKRIWPDVMNQRVLGFGDAKMEVDPTMRWDELADEVYREHGFLQDA
ncbi:hypothetical protein HDU96_006360, partial [Phlyctochytrium bullatum]